MSKQSMTPKKVTLVRAIDMHAHDSAARLIYRSTPQQLMKPNRNGETPLMRAVRHGMVHTAALLLDRGVDVHQETLFGWRAIHYSIRYRRFRCYQLLASRSALDAGGNLVNLSTLLRLALENDDDEIVIDLMARGARLQLANEGSNISSIEMAACGTCRMLGAVLHAGADPNPKGDVNFSPLLRAVMDGSPQNVKMLLEAGASVAVVDPWGKTALALALERGDPDVIALLVSNGAPAAVAGEQLRRDIINQIFSVVIANVASTHTGSKPHYGGTALNEAHSRLNAVASVEDLTFLLQRVHAIYTWEELSTLCSQPRP